MKSIHFASFGGEWPRPIWKRVNHSFVEMQIGNFATTVVVNNSFPYNISLTINFSKRNSNLLQPVFDNSLFLFSHRTYIASLYMLSGGFATDIEGIGGIEEVVMTPRLARDIERPL